MSKENMSDQKMEYYSQNAKLCRLVRDNPCMYDRTSPNYLRKEYVDQAWANIAREVNDSVGSCKERWRNIRTAFARSVNIYKTPTGPNRHKRYYLHDELQFLTKHISPGLPSLPIRILTPTELEENNENSRQSVDETDDNCTFQITIDSSSPPPPAQVEEEHIRTPEPDYTETPSSPVVKRRKMKDPDELIKDMLNVQRKNDPDAGFLNSLLPEMKAMNARQKILFKGKIFKALEDVFDDTKDFPNKVEPGIVGCSSVYAGRKTTNKKVGETMTNVRSTVNAAAQTQAERRDAQTSTSYAPMVTLGQGECHIKEEYIHVDVDD